MKRILRVLLTVVLLVVVAPWQSIQPVTAADVCEPDGCHLFLPLTHNAGDVLRVGMVTDSGGIDDNSFNQMTWQGVRDAEARLFIDGSYIEAGNEISYADAIAQMIAQGKELIVTVGFAMADATHEAAAAYPEIKFSIVDSSYDPPLDNVIGQVYASEQAAFLAGYLAAGMTETGTVATFGGMNIPPVTSFMNGFHQGVMYYNDENAASIEILGWDPDTQTGEFTNDFGNPAVGQAMAQQLINQGADIILPVAGPTGFGAAVAVDQAGEGWVIGVDTDWTVSLSQYSDVVLTSVMKNTGTTTYGVIKETLDDHFVGGTYAGVLANNGVGLGTIAAAVPNDLLLDLEDVNTAIVDGSIVVQP